MNLFLLRESKMEKTVILIVILVIACLSYGCQSLEEMEDEEDGGYTFIFIGDKERLEFCMLERDAIIEPFDLMRLVYRTLDPFVDCGCGAGGTESWVVHNKETFIQAKRVMNILDKRARQAQPGESFTKFIEEYCSGGFIHEKSELGIMLKNLREAANIEKDGNPELYAILLLILGSICEGEYEEGGEDTSSLTSALSIYTKLVGDETVPKVYRATALYREGCLLFKLNREAEAVVKTEKLLKEYKDFSDWQFYDCSNWTRTEYNEIQGGIDTIKILLVMCYNGYSGAVLATLGALAPERYAQFEEELMISPFASIFAWAEKQKEKKGITDETYSLIKEMYKVRWDTGYPATKVRQVWLWWLLDRRNFPEQKLPVDKENMKEYHLLEEFVNEVKKDSELAAKHKMLLEQILKEANSLKKQGK